MKVSRNEACPCGSGKKFKVCCGTGEKTRAGVMGGRILAVVVGVAVFGGVAIAINQFWVADLSFEPYVYDAKNDRYFDPLHGHMHQGRPPRGSGQGTQQAVGLIPQPWEYDAAKNQHYNPQHAHWHAGPPPDPAGRLVLPPVAEGLPTLPPLESAAVDFSDDGFPAAWDYDAENDTHWNPDTRSWNPGQPPIEAFTSDAGN